MSERSEKEVASERSLLVYATYQEDAQQRESSVDVGRPSEYIHSLGGTMLTLAEEVSASAPVLFDFAGMRTGERVRFATLTWDGDRPAGPPLTQWVQVEKDAEGLVGSFVAALSLGAEEIPPDEQYFAITGVQSSLNRTGTVCESGIGRIRQDGFLRLQMRWLDDPDPKNTRAVCLGPVVALTQVDTVDMLH